MRTVPRASRLKGIFGARLTSSRSSPIGVYIGGFYTVGGSLLEITLELGFPFVITLKSRLLVSLSVYSSVINRGHMKPLYSLFASKVLQYVLTILSPHFMSNPRRAIAHYN